MVYVRLALAPALCLLALCWVSMAAQHTKPGRLAGSRSVSLSHHSVSIHTHVRHRHAEANAGAHGDDMC